CTDQTGEPGPAHERLPHFRLEFTPSNGEEIQSEYFIAREHLAAALDAVMPLGERIRPLLHASEIRTVAADELWLSPAHRRDSACVHFTWKQLPQQVEALLPEIEERLAPLAPRPHWGKVFTLAPERVRAQYPRLRDFRTLRDRLDPQRVLRNAYVDRLLGECPCDRLPRPAPVPSADGLELLGQLRHHRHRGGGAGQRPLPRRAPGPAGPGHRGDRHRLVGPVGPLPRPQRGRPAGDARAHPGDASAAPLARLGWDPVVLCIDWSAPPARSHGYSEGAPLVMDAHGRVMPDPGRFPSAAHGAGFGPLAEEVHALGLKLGIHVMRGIPRRA